MKKIALFLTLITLAGCMGEIGSVTGVSPNSVVHFGPGVSMQYVDALSVVRDRDGQMMLQIRGLSDESQSVYYKVEWYDANGMSISSTLTQWKRVNVNANIEFTWKAIAPSKRAATYKVYIYENIGDGYIR